MNYWLIPNASSHDYGIQADNLILWIHIFMIALFVGWGAFYLYCLLRFRAKKGEKATYEPVKAKASKFLEVGIVVFEGFLLLGISVPAWNAFKESFPAEEDALHIRVVAHQFAWEFHFPGPDGKFGKTAASNFDAAQNVLGLDYDDPNAWDDIWVSANIELPKDVPVVADVTSLDVIHSFAVPAMRVKQDAVPGMKVPVWFQPAKAGTYDVVCSQLCGNSHYRMGGKITVVETREEFENWLAEQYPFVAPEDRPTLEPDDGAPIVKDEGTPAPDDGHDDSHDGHDDSGEEGDSHE